MDTIGMSVTHLIVDFPPLCVAVLILQILDITIEESDHLHYNLHTFLHTLNLLKKLILKMIGVLLG